MTELTIKSVVERTLNSDTFKDLLWEWVECIETVANKRAQEEIDVRVCNNSDFRSTETIDKHQNQT